MLKFPWVDSLGFKWLHNYSSAIAENLSHPTHDFGRVIAHADNSISTVLLCMLKHKLESIFASAFAQLRK